MVPVAVRPVEETVGQYGRHIRSVQPVVDGVGGSATTLAYGVTGDIRPFAYGVADEAGEIAPVAAGTAGRTGSVVRDLTGTVESAAAVPLVANAVGGVQDVAESVTPSCLPTGRGGSAYGV
ncbi:hypothetical protein ACJWDR_17435 [Streptomyces tauricus]|uniref:hypothetical protein n=1 Tax=Streptomyces tauricus TaxID=68274 RepID=UPI00387F36F7